jgi:hypothetical protein
MLYKVILPASLASVKHITDHCGCIFLLENISESTLSAYHQDK